MRLAVTVMLIVVMSFAYILSPLSEFCGVHDFSKDKEDFEVMKTLFADEIDEFGELFTARKARAGDDSVTHYYYFAYNKKSDDYSESYTDFFEYAVDFCIYADRNVFKTDEDYGYVNLFFLYDWRYYVKFSVGNKFFETDIFCEDYSAFESYPDISALYISTYYFDHEQTAALNELIRSDPYSFGMSSHLYASYP